MVFFNFIIISFFIPSLDLIKKYFNICEDKFFLYIYILAALLAFEVAFINFFIKHSPYRSVNTLGFHTTLTYISTVSSRQKISQIIVTLNDNTIYTCYNTTNYSSANIKNYICDKHGNIALYVESIKYPNGKEIVLKTTTHGKVKQDLITNIPKEQIKLIQFNISRKNLKKPS